MTIAGTKARGVALAMATVLAGCGTTEKSGSVGDTLEANRLEVTVQRVDRSVPRPESDVTGLSLPRPGAKLVGVRARVCSEHGGAIGPFNFGVEASGDEKGRLKFPSRNYSKPFETVRDGCGGGWVVFEIPEDSELERVTFGFEDTGAVMKEQNRVDARFSWSVADS